MSTTMRVRCSIASGSAAPAGGAAGPMSATTRSGHKAPPRVAVSAAAVGPTTRSSLAIAHGSAPNKISARFDRPRITWTVQPRSITAFVVLASLCSAPGCYRGGGRAHVDGDDGADGGSSTQGGASEGDAGSDDSGGTEACAPA